jgi:hypothetical protein
MSHPPHFQPKPRKRADGSLVEIPLDLSFWALSTGLDTSFGGVLLSYLATHDKLEELASTDWYDESSDRFENKTRLKELGGAVFSYSDFLVASTIHLLSNILEDTWIEMKRDLRDFTYDLWRPPINAEEEKAARTVRAAANVLKHNQGRLDTRTSEHARYLVNECGLTDGFELTLFAQGDEPKLDPLDLIYRCYLYCLDLASKAYECRNWTADLEEDTRKQKVFDALLPSISGLKPPNR